MSTEKIFGSWNETRTDVDHLDRELQMLWHKLAAQHVGTPQFQPNSGLSQRKHEITMLWQLFHLQQPKVIVEIGVAQGGTFAGWCQLAPPDATLIGMDRDLRDCRPRPGDPVHPSIYDGPLKFSDEGGGIHSLARGVQKVIAINGWTYDERVMRELLVALNGRKIDFLFHDASHSESMARKDFDLFWPLVAEGGIMAFHDIQESKAPNCDKSEWWKSCLNTAEYSAAFIFKGSRNDDSLGIGVLIK